MSSLKPLVSVLMSTYNENIDDLKKAIDSILNQTYKNIEFIIIIDNPDNKELVDFLNEYSKEKNKIRIMRNNQNIGLVKSLNKGIKICRGKYIARMDADDISNIERLQKQVIYLEENTDIFIVGTDISFIDEDDNDINMKSRCIEDSKDIQDALKYKNCMNHPTWMIRKELFDCYITDAYREIPFAEDYDLICRVNAKNLKVSNINEKLLKYRIRENGISVSNSYKQLISSKYVKHIYRKSMKLGIDSYNIEELNNILNSKSKIYDMYTNIKIKKQTKKGLNLLATQIAEKTISLANKFTREDLFDELNMKKITNINKRAD